MTATFWLPALRRRYHTWKRHFVYQQYLLDATCANVVHFAYIAILRLMNNSARSMCTKSVENSVPQREHSVGAASELQTVGHHHGSQAVSLMEASDQAEDGLRRPSVQVSRRLIRK